MSYPTRPTVRPASSRRPVRTRAAAAATLAGLLVAATGCGSYQDESPQAAGTRPAAGTDASAPASTPAALDPCTLLAGDELDGLAGTHLEQEGPAFEQARGRACRWSIPGAPGIGGAELVITTWRGREFYLAGTIGEDEPGIGDEAQADRSLGMVLFRSGEDVVSTQVLATSEKDLALDVARAAADALAG